MELHPAGKCLGLAGMLLLVVCSMQPERIAIIPKPWTIRIDTASFILPAQVVIDADSLSSTTASWLTHLLSRAGCTAGAGPASRAQVVVRLDRSLIPWDRRGTPFASLQTGLPSRPVFCRAVLCGPDPPSAAAAGDRAAGRQNQAACIDSGCGYC